MKMNKKLFKLWLNLFPIFMALLLIISCQSKSNEIISYWADMTLKDLEMAHSQLEQNTVAALNDSAFKNWLEKGFNEAKVLAKKVNDFDGYLAVLKFYLAGFYDGHVRVHSLLQSTNVNWADFLLRYIDGKYFITYLGDEITKQVHPEVGDELTSIDGIEIKKYVLENIFKYNEFIPTLEAGWIEISSYVTLRNPNPFVTLPKQYTVNTRGQTKTFDFQWKNITDHQAFEILNKANGTLQNDFEIRDFLSDQGIWITIPTFNLSTDEKRSKFKNLLSKVSQYRQRKLVVIDLRGNGGGNSEWGVELLKQLFGEDYVSAKLSDKSTNSYSLYRVSPSNFEHFQQLLIEVVKWHGENSFITQYVSELVKKMGNSIEQRDFGVVKLETEEEDEVNSLESSKDVHPKFEGEIYLLTSTSCGSSCLAFVDKLTTMPNVTHVGLPTYADTPYLESRKVTLPSKNAILIFPTSAIIGRKRQSNEPYTPKYKYSGDLNDTYSVEKWLRHIYEDGSS